MTKGWFMRLVGSGLRKLIAQTLGANGAQLSGNSDSLLAISPEVTDMGLTKDWRLWWRGFLV